VSGELWRRSALELAGMIARREVTSRQVVEEHLARVDAVNPRLNAVVRRLDDEALRAADAADAAVAAGTTLGRFHGVPITVKENIDLAGTPTTQALPALADAVADRDAPVVERMRAAGAIPIGRTNLPDLGLRVFTESSLHGITDNPWKSGHTSGGSSGGEGAAIASGMSPLGLGNDIGGSLRNPAHCCGIASIKPSTGVVPSATVVPPEDASIVAQLMLVEGVMARTVADVRAGLATVAGPHERDPLALPVRLGDVPADRPLRVAVAATPPGGDTHPGVADAIRRAADALADAGAEVVEAAPDSFEEALELWARMLMEELRVQLPLIELVMGADGLRFLSFAADRYPALDWAGLAGVFTARHRVDKQWHRFLTDHDVLLTPVWTCPAPPHGYDISSYDAALSTLEAMRPVLPANLLGLPAAVAPAGVVDGLPVGAQFTARRFCDLAALSAAALLEQRIGVLTPVEPFG
jgi:amidase